MRGAYVDSDWEKAGVDVDGPEGSGALSTVDAFFAAFVPFSLCACALVFSFCSLPSFALSGESVLFSSFNRFSSPLTRLSNASNTSVFGPLFLGMASVMKVRGQYKSEDAKER